MEALSPIVFELPFPPSVNHYWRRVGARTLISKEGRLFRQRVADELSLFHLRPLEGSIEVLITVHPPDRRRRDLDNLLKALLDALERGGVYRDDSQIDRLEIVRASVVKGGSVIVEINEIQPVSTENLT